MCWSTEIKPGRVNETVAKAILLQTLKLRDASPDHRGCGVHPLSISLTFPEFYSCSDKLGKNDMGRKEPEKDNIPGFL
jgi:hypothetical protein